MEERKFILSTQRRKTLSELAEDTTAPSRDSIPSSDELRKEMHEELIPRLEVAAARSQILRVFDDSFVQGHLPGQGEDVTPWQAEYFRKLKTFRGFHEKGFCTFQSKVGLICKLMPEFPPLDVFVEQLQMCEHYVPLLAQGTDDPDEMRSDIWQMYIFEKLVEKLDYQLYTLANAYAAQYYSPLVETALSDVRRYLIFHANTALRDDPGAAAWIDEKFEMVPEVHFQMRAIGYWKAQAGFGKVTVFLPNIPTTEDGRIDEAQLLAVLIHEFLHIVTLSSKDSQRGLIDHTLFEEGTAGYHSRKANLFNELFTELLAIDLMSKYYSKNPPGALKLHLGNEQGLRGYEELIRGYRQLQHKYPKASQELSALLAFGMMNSDTSRLKIFFAAHPDILKELHMIIDRESMSIELKEKNHLKKA